MSVPATDGIPTGARAYGWRALLLLVVLVAFVLVAALVHVAALLSVARAAEGAAWRFAPAEAPPPPQGVAPGPYGVPLGVVGEISFWAPNRGLLITGGTTEAGGPVASGVYAYDGVSWHQLATVCGGAQGRVVWAGPDEFWTIANQRAGQQLATSNTGEEEAPAVSLCHFVGDQVVASYAVPLDEVESWRQMTGGACYTPSDCWFGGFDGVAPHAGAFHLYWNGSAVTAIYEPEDHAVTSVAAFGGVLYEAVQLGSQDEWLSEAERKRPAVMHTIAAEGAEPAFGDFQLISPLGKRLPEYGEKVEPEALQGFDLEANAPAGTAATELWAAANPATNPPASSKPASVTVMHASLSDGEPVWSQLVPNAAGETPLADASLAGSELGVGGEWGTSGAIAPEPGGQDAWLSLHSSGATAHIALLEPRSCETGGKQEMCTSLHEFSLPEAGEAIGPHGAAGPIVCPAAHDCWLATYAEPAARAGWLFHLSDGAPEEADDDPLFDGADGVIGYRPRDSGVPPVYPDGFAEDDSLANQQSSAPPVEVPGRTPAKSGKEGKAKPLVKDVKSAFVHKRTLVISFTLTARAHVQLIARRNRLIVAKTRKESLRPGRHELSLSFDPARWPTKLQFKATPTEHVASTGAEGSESESGNVVGT